MNDDFVANRIVTMDHSLPDDALLEEVVEQFTRELRHGQLPQIAKYQQQYPHLSQEIHELLSSVAMIEGLKTPTEPVNSLNRRLDETLEVRQLGDYRLIREIGRGGMGIVFEAIHQSLGRQVAVKVLPNRSIDNQQQVDRFRREAQAAARLHHPHIVNVFGVGHDQGYHYYVMEYVDGPSLKQTIRAMADDRSLAIFDRSTRADSGSTTFEAGNPPTGSSDSDDLVDRQNRFLPTRSQQWKWSVQVMAGIADALDYAHQNQLLHRDIKPGNLLVDPSGTVRLTDFGLAKHLEEKDLTRTGDLLGTPQYMAPEALEGRYDVRSEVYALGLVLYELVTRTTAFEPSTTAGVLYRISSTKPKSPRLLNPEISRDLEVVIQKAMAREPADRYQTASDLRDDLQCLLLDRPISARRPTIWEQAHRWSRNNPTTAVMTVAIFLLLLLVTLSTTVGYAYTQSAYYKLGVQHRLLTDEQRKTEAARALAVANEKRIQQEFDRAQANVQVSLQAFDEIFLQLVAPEQLPGDRRDSAVNLDIAGLNELAGIQSSVTDQDAQFLKRMLTFYETIAAENAQLPEMELQRAKASRRVANTYHLIGNLEEAQDAYEETIKQYENLRQREPESGTIGLTLARVYNEAGQASRDRRPTVDAIRLYQKARRLLIDHPAGDQREMRLELARTYNLLSAAEPEPNETPLISEDFFGLLEDHPLEDFQRRRREQRQRVIPVRLRQRMLQNLDQAILICEELQHEFPEDPEALFMHAISLRSKARLLDGQLDDPAGPQALQQARTDLENLVQRQDQPEYQYELAVTLGLAFGNQRPDPVDLEKALAMIDTLLESYPRNLEYQQLHVALRLDQARHQYEDENQEALIESLQASTGSLSFLVQSAPELIRYRFEYGYVVYALSSELMESRQPREAQRVLVRAINDLRQKEQEKSVRQATRRILVKLCDQLANVYRQVGDSRRERQWRMESQKLQIPRGRSRN